jgi:acyl-coenzyme A thioesterase PaaI-like protein
MKLSVEHSPFHRLLGLELVRAQDGDVEMRLPWREEFRRADDS